MPDLLRDIGERELIRRYITPLITKKRGNIVDDDCAVIDIPCNQSLLISTDRGPRTSFLELLNVGTAADLGHFHAIANISDIAAMGGEPFGILLALALPADEEVEFLQDYLSGLTAALDEYSVGLYGGDTKQASMRSATITVMGLQLPEGRLSRTGAQPGDSIFVGGGPIGMVLNSYIAAAIAEKKGGKHDVLRPTAQISLGMRLVREGLCTSCLDMSDGLLGAAEQLAKRNRLSFVIDIDLVPFSSPPINSGEGTITRWINLAANVGSDFGLMFTASPSDEQSLVELGAARIGYVAAADVGGIVLKGHLADQIRMAPWEQFSTVQNISGEITNYVR